jgi:PAS domain S-box-containing protein
MQTLSQKGVLVEATDLVSPNKKNVIRVLHVDDDQAIREITKMMLLDLDSSFEIDWACCVDEAFEKLAAGHYDVLVSDYEMPQKDGLQFLKELREKNNKIPFILFTGKGREDVAIKALNLGADAYCNKQGDPETVYGELSHVIKRSVEHHKAKKQLRDQNSLLVKTASQTPGMLFQFMRRPNGTYCVPYTSEAIRSIFGCSPQEVREDFSPISRVIVPEDIENVFQSIEYSANHLTPWQCEYRVQIPGQQIRWLWGQSIPEKLVDGSIVWNGYNADVTDRKRAAETLADSEAKYRALVENADDAILLTDLRGKNIYRNRAHFKSLGFEEGDEAKIEELMKVHPDDVSLLKQKMSELFQTGYLTSEYRIKNFKGSWAYRHARSTLIYNISHQPYAIITIIRDITERKKAEDALSGKEKRFRAIFDKSFQFALILDINGNVLEMNELCYTVHGPLAEGCLGKPFWKAAWWSQFPEVAEKTKLAIQSCQVGKIVHDEVKFIDKDFQIHHGIRIFSPIAGDNGNLLYISVVGLDISERKKAEGALGISEAKYRGLADSLPEIVFETDINGILTYANQSAFEITGYTKEDLAKGVCAFDLVAQKEREKAKDYFRKTLTGKSSVKNEYTFIRKDGSAFPIIIASNPIEVENKFVGLRGIAINITELKRLEENLKNEKQKLQNVIDCTGVGTWEWNVLTGEAVINDKWAEIVGYTKEELEPVSIETWRKLAHPVDLVKSNELAQMHFEGKTEYYSFDSRMRHKDGSWIWVFDQGKVVEWTTDGKPLKMFGTHTDITQRKKAEQEFAAEQALVQEVVNSTDAVIFSVDKNYRYSSFNRSHASVMKAIYGVDIQIGKNILDYMTITIDREKAKHNLDKALAGKKLIEEAYSGDDQLSRNYFIISHNPIRNAKGNVTGVVVVCNDVTDHKKTEEELKKDQAKMEILNEKLNVIGRLTRHDVGNKLMVIKSNIYLLKKQIGDNPKLAKYLEDIASAIKQSDEMFEFSRFYEKIGVERPSEIDVAQCFNQAVALLPNLGTIKIVNECQGLSVMADSLLKQLFYNFLDNSLKHGEKVTQVRLYFINEGDGVKLFYEDDGVGILEGNKPKLFHEGFTTGKSTGLGLFLIKKMVEVYGWTITEEGEQGKGAKFTLTIPKLNKNRKENYQIVP